jgi:hypothetical protein
MARGRKPKIEIDHAKVLKQYAEEQRLQLETFYKDLAKVKYQVDLALTQIGFMDEAENLSQAAFRAGRAFGPLDQANDRLEEILEDIFGKTDLDHWDDVVNN